MSKVCFRVPDASPSSSATPYRGYPAAVKGWMLLMLLWTVSCAPSPRDQDEDQAQEAIRQQAERWVAAANAGDAESLARLYSPQAVTMPPDHASVVGRDTICALFEKQFETYEAHYDFTIGDVVVSGDLAVRRGSYVVTLQPHSEGQELVIRDKFVDVWQREGDGMWRITWDIWNTNPK